MMGKALMKEFVGCVSVVSRNEGENARLKFIPVLIQSIKGEFKKPEALAPSVPAKYGIMLTKNDDKVAKILPAMTTKYLLGTGKLMHVMCFSRLETNVVWQLARLMSELSKKSFEKMYQAILQCCKTRESTGASAKRQVGWQYILQVENFSKSNLDYAKDPDSQHTVIGGAVYIESAPLFYISATQKMITLSVMEAELPAVVTAVKDTIFLYHVIMPLAPKATLPMKL